MVTFTLNKTLSNSLHLKLKQNDWNLDKVLPIDFIPSPELWDVVPLDTLAEFRQLLSRDVYSEGDAQILYDYLLTRSAEFSDDFWQMLDLWLEDELKHYEALRRVYHTVCGVSYTEMNQVFAERTPVFEPIKLVLANEFTILVTICFDELGSIFSYRRDLRQFYGYFGQEIKSIGKHLVQDEGAHFNNAIQLLLSYHQDKLHLVAPFLRQVVELENSLGKYYQSFLLDHAQEQARFPKNFNDLVVEFILGRLGLANSPDGKELKQLWHHDSTR